MNKILARGGIEFIAVLLGLTLSLWIDENAKENEAISQNDEILSRLYKNLRADSSDGAWNKKAYERGIGLLIGNCSQTCPSFATNSLIAHHPCYSNCVFFVCATLHPVL